MSAPSPIPGKDASALVVLVPEAERYVGSLRSRYDESGAAGLPAHVTVSSPFVPPGPDGRVDARTRAALAELFGGLASFRFVLAGVCGFPGVVYLAPEPPRLRDERGGSGDPAWGALDGRRPLPARSRGRGTPLAVSCRALSAGGALGCLPRRPS